jgi:hypothetical protein
MIIMM